MYKRATAEDYAAKTRAQDKCRSTPETDMGLFATCNILLSMWIDIKWRLPRYAPFAVGNGILDRCVTHTHQYYDMKCRRTGQIFLSICRVGLIRSHRSDPRFKAIVKQNGAAVSTLGEPVAAQSVSSSVVMRMLTAIFGSPCPIGLPNTSSNLWPQPAPVGTE